MGKPSLIVVDSLSLRISMTANKSMKQSGLATFELKGIVEVDQREIVYNH